MNSGKNSPSEQEKGDPIVDKQIENGHSESNVLLRSQDKSQPSPSELKSKFDLDNQTKNEKNEKESENKNYYDEHVELESNTKITKSQEREEKINENAQNNNNQERFEPNEEEETSINKKNQYINDQVNRKTNENGYAGHETTEKSMTTPAEDPNNENIPKQKVSKEDFDILGSLGKGSFGEVHLVRKVGGEELYAMKGLDKHFLFKVKMLTNRNK